MYREMERTAFSFEANEEDINNVRIEINEMFASKRKYRYDMIGVVLAKFGKNKKRKYRYYCSDFVKEILIKYNILKREECPEIMKPMDFLSINGGEVIYEGSLHDYCNNIDQEQ